MDEFWRAVQQQAAALTPWLIWIVMALPGAGLGGLVSGIISERFKKGYQIELEGVRKEHQKEIEKAKGEHQREIEQLKSELARDLSRDVESLKSQLGVVAFERQTRFVRLHERRVEVIAELYRKLVKAEQAFIQAIGPLRSGASSEAIQSQQQEDDKAAVAAGNDFQSYYLENRVWLNDGLCTSIEALATKFRTAWVKYSSRNRPGDWGEGWGEAWQQITEDVPKTRAEIEIAMRMMLAGSLSNEPPMVVTSLPSAAPIPRDPGGS